MNKVNAFQPDVDEEQLRRNGKFTFSLLLFLGLFLVSYYAVYPQNGFIIFQFGLLSWIISIPIVLNRFRLDFCSLLFLSTSFCFASYSLKPIYLALGEGVIINDPSSEKAIWYVILFISLLIFAYFLSVGERTAHRIPALPQKWHPESVMTALYILMCFGVIGWIVILIAVGKGPVSLYTDVFHARDMLAKIPFAYFFRNAVIWAFSSVFWVPYLYNMFRDKGEPRLLSNTFLIPYFIFMMVLFAGFGQRSIVIAQILGLFVVSNLARKKGITTVLIAVILISIFSRAYLTYREASRGGTSVAQISRALKHDYKEHGPKNLSVMTIISTVNIFEFLPIIVSSYPTVGHDFLYGKSYVNCLTLLLPRSIFSWKEPYTDTYLTQIMRDELIKKGSSIDAGKVSIVPDMAKRLERGLTINFGLLAELYINFGAIAIATGAVVCGIILRILETYLGLHKRNPGVVL